LRFLERLTNYLVYLGVPGLFLIALLDSAAVPMVGGPDAVIVLLAWHDPSKAPWIIMAAAVGSVIGCLILYRIGRAGGELALAKVSKEKRERVMRMVEQNATWAAFVSVTMPPPFPTKPVILASGMFRAPIPAFASAIFVGRLIRFSALAWLGARFGDQAAKIIKSHYLSILACLAVAVVLFMLVRKIRSRAATGVGQ
jgi:membrane protein YqaA with SNARE-associated domain